MRSTRESAPRRSSRRSSTEQVASPPQPFALKVHSHSLRSRSPATYDKERAERSWTAAVQVAGAFAARFE